MRIYQTNLWHLKCKGIMTGWASAAVVELRSNETLIFESGPISSEQASWIPALKSLTFVLNIPIFGFIANRYGRKWPLNFLAIPLMVRLYDMWDYTYKNWMKWVNMIINIFVLLNLDLMAAHLLCKEYLLHLCSAIYTRLGYGWCVFTVTILFCRDSGW